MQSCMVFDSVRVHRDGGANLNSQKYVLTRFRCNALFCHPLDVYVAAAFGELCAFFMQYIAAPPSPVKNDSVCEIKINPWKYGINVLAYVPSGCCCIGLSNAIQSTYIRMQSGKRQSKRQARSYALTDFFDMRLLRDKKRGQSDKT